MSRGTVRRAAAVVAILAAGSLISAAPAAAHCDGLDGPVVEAARRSLETGDVRYALVWVLAEHEAEIRHAFDHAMKVRALGEEARELADRHFFETLVRVHRAGEGAPYTGLKPAGRDLGPAIPAADRALASGEVGELETIVLDEVRARLRELYEAAAALSRYEPTDVAAGRKFVEAYVPFIHYVEEVYALASGHGHAAEHGHEAAGAGTHGHE